MEFITMATTTTKEPTTQDLATGEPATKSTTTKKPYRRLLSLKKLNPATKHFTQRNAEQSWFLRLPAEIRNRVYDLAMAGRDLHISTRTNGKLLTYSCKAAVNEDEFVAKHKNSGFVDAYDHQHLGCKNANSEAGINVALLEVCRPIYRKAALVPFTSNKFILNGQKEFLQFNKQLIPTQLRAVQVIRFITTRPGLYPPISQYRFQHFTGLRFLGLRLEFHSHGEEGDIYYEDFKHLLSQFARGQLTSVEVIPYLRPGNRSYWISRGAMHPKKPETLAFAEDLRSELLMSKEQLEEKHQKEKAAEAKAKRDQEKTRKQKLREKKEATAKRKRDEEDNREQDRTKREQKRTKLCLRSLKAE